MSRFTFVAGSTIDLRRLWPVAAEVKRRGNDVALHWIGGEPPSSSQASIDTAHQVDPGGDPARLAAAAAAALQTAPTAVVVAGCGPVARATAAAAQGAGVPVLHVDAGTRDFSAMDGAARDIDRRTAMWLCTARAQADNLLREGMPAARVHVVGSTLANGLATAPTDDRIALFVADADLLATLTVRLQPVAKSCGLRLAPMPGGPAFDPTALAGARAVVTDSADVQEAACALQIPCVTVSPFTARPETVDCGANQVAGPEGPAVQRALEIALALRQPWTSPYADGVEAAAALIAGFGDRTGETPTAPMLLPGDGDWTGRTLGQEECELVVRALRSGTLNSTKGTFVTRFEQEFARRTGRRFAVACASGSAAVHCAINALQLQPGDEVVTTPITDMGALTCILYEGGIPVFADVDPVTINVTAETIAAQLTNRTRAIVVTHLFGLPCDMQPIVELARARGLPLIEDMAQAFGSEERTGRPGTFGAISCYSLQQGKHMTTGEGGIVTTDDEALARRVFLFVNKAWGYGDPRPDHYFPAPNFRLTELQGAVALGQLRKLDWVVVRRRAVAAQLTAALQGTPGLLLPDDPPGGRHSWWKYAFFVDPAVVDGGAVQLGKRMKDRGVFCVPRYIQKPAFECQLFQDFSASPVTAMPLQHSARRDRPQPLFQRADYPGAVRALERVIVLPINELYTEAYVAWVTGVIRKEAEVLAHA